LLSATFGFIVSAPGFQLAGHTASHTQKLHILGVNKLLMAEISYEIIQYNTARQNYALFLTEHKLPSVLYSWERNFGSFVGFSRLPITETPPRMAQHCGPTAAVAVVSRDPTFVPRTPATSPENNRRVHLSLVCPRQGLVTGACAREGGKCRSTGAVVGRLYRACATPATAAEAASMSTDTHGLQP